MNFKSQICTTREQSKRLLALGLKPGTADMVYHYTKSRVPALEWELQTKPPTSRGEFWTPQRIAKLAFPFHKHPDGTPMTGEEVFKRGDAQLFEIGYTGSNYAVMAQFRRLNYMQSQLYRPDGGSGSLGLLPGNTINYIPALSPQHTYMLAGLDPNSPQQNGEIGGQIDALFRCGIGRQ